MASNILLPISDTISTAWQKVHGAKATIWGAFAIVVLIGIIFAILVWIGDAVHPNLEPVIGFIGQLINLLLQMGLVYIGIRRAFDSPIRSGMVFHALNLNLAVKIIVLYILEALIIFPVAFIFLFLPSLLFPMLDAPNIAKLLMALFYLIGFFATFYLVIRMLLALGFILDTNSSPWEAIKRSFMATKNNFWRLVVMLIVKLCSILIGIATLGIGLIWAIPFITILYGVVYRKLKDNAIVA